MTDNSLKHFPDLQLQVLTASEHFSRESPKSSIFSCRITITPSFSPEDRTRTGTTKEHESPSAGKWRNFSKDKRCLVKTDLLGSYLSGDDGYFWYGRFCKCKQQFGSMSDDASVLLSRTCSEASEHVQEKPLKT